MPTLSKPAKTGLIVAAICLLIAATIGGAIYGATKLSDTSSGPCKSTTGTTHTAVIQDDRVNPAHTNAKLCDKLVIINKDTEERIMAFGQHEKHVHYDGIEEKVLAQDQKFSVTLIQAGSYKFHDHEHDEVQGTFTVTDN